MDEIARYEWLESSPIGGAACVTFVEGMDLAEVAAAFGGSLADAADVDDATDDDIVVLRQAGGWVLVIENNGWQGSRPEVLRRLRGGRAVSCFWNVNALTRFSSADRGTVITDFEALFPDDRGGADPDALEDVRATLPWDDPDVLTEPLMLALAARITGVTLTPDLMTGPMRAVPLRPWPDDVAQQVSPRHEMLTDQDPEVSYALQHADEPALRRVAGIAADHAARAAGIAVAPDRLDDLARDLERADRPAQLRAVEAARAATSTDALAAAFGAVTAARYAILATRADPQPLRDAVLAELGRPEPPRGSGGHTGDAWLDGHWLGWAGCATYVRGTPADQVLAALGGAPEPAGTGPVALSTRPLAWVRAIGAWIVVLEPGERHRPADQLLERLSGGGESVQAVWSARGGAWLRHAVGGELRVRFNGFAPEQVWGTDPHSLDALVAQLPIPRPGADGGGQAAGLLRLAARMTGVDLAAPTLDEPWRSHPQR